MKKRQIATALICMGLVGGVSTILFANRHEATHALAEQKTQSSQAQTPVAKHIVKSPTIDFSQTGPIQHIVWDRTEQTDEYWQNVETGEWRSVMTDHARGIVKTAIAGKDHILYVFTTQDGKLVSAEKIPQLNNDGKSMRIIDNKKINDVSKFKFVKDDTINGRSVKVWENKLKTPEGQAVSQKIVVDQATRLPLQIESARDGASTVQTWSYSYLPYDASLFQIPGNITFKEMPPVDSTPGK